jgi:peptide/nickel transport system ATP-binding protein
MESSLLKIKNLSVEYTVNKYTAKAVNNLYLEIGHGECVGLVGETGAGKTTSALGIMRLIPDPPGKIISGVIEFEGENLLEVSEKKMRSIRGSMISMIFQDPMTSLNPIMRVGDQIMETILLHENISKVEAAVKAQRMLEMVGIPAERYNEYPHQFSGGMKQRVVIACALVCNPKLLIADEPTTALDVTIQAQVLELIKKLKVEFNTAMLMITHDLGVVRDICDKVNVMYAGSIVESGTVEQVFDYPQHPYTQGLFKSIPDLDTDSERLEPILGMMPDPGNLPQGCAFAPRCSKSIEKCRTERPDIIQLDDGHFVSCFLFSTEEE